MKRFHLNVASLLFIVFGLIAVTQAPRVQASADVTTKAICGDMCGETCTTSATGRCTCVGACPESDFKLLQSLKDEG